MNKIKLANIIVKKRREKGVTQEELAEYMGVSKAAVSKWEKQQSYPDITLLPDLATYFNLSIDELLNYTPQLTKKDIRKLYHEIAADFSLKPFSEVWVECKKIIKKYYSCFPLLYQMTVLLINHHALAKDQRGQQEVLMTAKSLCERIMDESNDALLTKETLLVLCYLNLTLQEPDVVFQKIGKSLHHQPITEDYLISQAYQQVGNVSKAKEIAQCAMYQYINQLLETTLNYISLSHDNLEIAKTAFFRLMELIQLYQVKKLNPNLVLQTHLIGADLSCKCAQPDDALLHLTNYVDLCIHDFFPFRLQGDTFFTAIDVWLDSCEIGSAIPRDEALVKQSMLQGLSAYPSFSLLHDKPQYQQLVRKLSKFVILK
jgi:transcriptional regulator with XRE-family HTH domain